MRVAIPGSHNRAQLAQDNVPEPVKTSLANLVQILGVAAPTSPVLANGKYGVKP